MMEDRWVLGVDLGAHGMKLSFLQDSQEEVAELVFDYKEEEKEKAGQDAIFKIVDFLRQQQLNLQDGQVVFSMETVHAAKMKKVRQSLEYAGFLPGKIQAVSRENAFAHYVMRQEASLYHHKVLLFDFDGKELYGYRLAHSRKKLPERFEAESFFIGSFSLVGKSGDWGKIFDEQFAAIARQRLSKEVVSAVFLTGAGFMGDWLSKSLNVLCSGRRAFISQNLFSTGCCYYGMGAQNKDAVVCVPESVLHEASVFDGARGERPAVITQAGKAWYDTKGGIEVIPEKCSKLEIVFTDIFTKEKQVEAVDISGLGPRPRKTGRLYVEVEFVGSKKGMITVRDLGFGAFYPVSNQVFLKEFALL